MTEMRQTMATLPTRQQFENFEQTMRRNSEMTIENKSRIEEHDKRITTIRNSIERIENEQIQARRGIDRRIEQAVGNLPTNQTKSDYAKARRSVRIWPIKGDATSEIKKNVMEFFVNALGLREQEIGAFEARREESQGEKHLIYDEVVVCIKDAGTRDKILLRGPRLSSYVDAHKKPTCGIRLEIPHHLVPSFRILHRYGMNLRRRAGNQVKKYVKFDDFSERLFLQVKIDEGGEWLNITPEQADVENKKQDAKRSDRLDRIEEKHG